MFCGESSIGLHEPGLVRYAPLRCNQWQCQECLHRRLRKLRDLARAGLPNAFLTLTVNPDRFRDMDEAARALVRAWRNIRQRAAREGIASKIPYLAVFEETKKGWPHLHILIRSPYIPQKWLSDRMHEYAGSPVVDIRAVKTSRGASQYIAKYVSKGPGRFEGTKRYWRSQDWVLDDSVLPADQPVADRSAWIEGCDTGWHAATWASAGWLLEWETDTVWRATPGPGAYWPGPPSKRPDGIKRPPVFFLPEEDWARPRSENPYYQALDA